MLGITAIRFSKNTFGLINVFLFCLLPVTSFAGKSEFETVVKEERLQTMTESLELFPVMRDIARMIEDAFVYPRDLADHEIQGDVIVKIRFDKEGNLTFPFASVTAENQILEAYCTVVLLKTFEKNLPQIHKKSFPVLEKQTISVKVRFIPELFQGFQESKKTIEQNSITIEKRAYRDPKLTKIIRKIERYMPMIYPLPGGFAIDVVRVIEFIDKVGKHEVSDEEKAKQRFQSLKESLLSSVKKKE